MVWQKLTVCKYKCWIVGRRVPNQSRSENGNEMSLKFCDGTMGFVAPLRSWIDSDKFMISTRYSTGRHACKE